MPHRISRFSTWPRGVRWLAWSLLGLQALYLLAGNVFLNTPLFDAVTNRKAHKFVMSTGPAITLLPGHVIAWNVHMRGHVNHTVYVLHADRASARLAVLPLFHREVRVPYLQATGVSAEVERVEDVVPSPPRGDQGWTLRFDAIHSDSIRSARFGKLLLQGDGSGTVGFVKQLRGGPSQLLDSRVDFNDAYASYDGVQLLSDVRLKSTFRYPRHYRDQAPGIRKFTLVEGTLDITARSQGLRMNTGAQHVAIASSPLAGQLQAHVDLQRGALKPGTRAIWRVPLQLGDGAPDRGVLALQLDVGQDMRLQARLPARPERGAALDADLRIRGHDVPFADPASLLERSSGQVQGEWTFTSLNWIPALFVRKPWLQLDGGGVLKADLRVQDGELVAGSTVDLPHAQAVADVAGVRMAGVASAHGELKPGTPARAELHVRLPRFSARTQDKEAATLFDGHDLALQLVGDGRLRELRRGVRARLQFADARIPDLAAYNRFLGNGQVRLVSGTARLSGDIGLDTDGRIGKGTARLVGQGAHLQLAGLDLRADTRVDGRLQRGDFRQRWFDLTGSAVELRNVQIDGRAGSQGWQGRLDVDEGRIDGQAPFQVDARARVAMSDAGPLLAVFAERGDYPSWVLKLLDSGQVEAKTALRWQPGHLVLDDLQAENDRFALRARLDLRQQRRRGDLYLRWGVLGAGIELDGDRRQWHLAGARDWFDGRPALLAPAP